jgi:2-oxoglutarate ferredoxin oxidoreductase subunit delta
VLKGRIEIDIDKCKGCEICITACKQNVIALSGSDKLNAYGYLYLVAVDPDKCNGCALCGQMCPDSAITVYREVRKKKT